MGGGGGGHTSFHVLAKAVPIFEHLFPCISELDSSPLQVLCLFSIAFSILELNPSSKYITLSKQLLQSAYFSLSQNASLLARLLYL